jgi:hypothetical protein
LFITAIQSAIVARFLQAVIEEIDPWREAISSASRNARLPWAGVAGGGMEMFPIASSPRCTLKVKERSAIRGRYWGGGIHWQAHVGIKMTHLIASNPVLLFGVLQNAVLFRPTT